MMIGLIVLVIVISFKKDKRAMKGFLMISLPLIILFQFYFWNLNFNNYVKSYLFASKGFECEYEEELKNLIIPLPERTVFKGKQDGCSPFYITYVNVTDFESFYQKELKSLKNQGKIQSYRDIERTDKDWTEDQGFVVELPSGSTIEIFTYTIKGSGIIAIDYQRSH